MEEERVLLLGLVVVQLDLGNDLTVPVAHPPHTLKRGTILQADLLQTIVELVDVDFRGVVVEGHCPGGGEGGHVRGENGGGVLGPFGGVFTGVGARVDREPAAAIVVGT